MGALLTLRRTYSLILAFGTEALIPGTNAELASSSSSSLTIPRSRSAELEPDGPILAPLFVGLKKGELEPRLHGQLAYLSCDGEKRASYHQEFVAVRQGSLIPL